MSLESESELLNETGDSNSYVIYTCVTDNYDTATKAPAGAGDVPTVYFTDRNRGAPHGWSVKALMSPPRISLGHDINRYHKMFPHRLFPEYRYSVYLDGNIEFEGDLGETVARFAASGAALGAFQHPAGRSLREEVAMCRELGKFDRHDLQRYQSQLSAYQDEGFSLSDPITANYFLVRDHYHPRIQTAMSLWWSQTFEFTKRDQVSLGYVLWKTQLPWVFLDKVPVLAVGRVLRTGHRRSLRERMVNRCRRALGVRC